MIGQTTDDIISDFINDVTMSFSMPSTSESSSTTSGYQENNTTDKWWTNITYNATSSLNGETQQMQNNNTHMFEKTHYSISDKADNIFSELGIISYILCFIGLVANICSIIATCNIPIKQTAHYKLIINLAISDSMVIVAIVLHDCVYIFTNDNECIANLARDFLLAMALIATLLNLFVMAVDHYLAIVFPMSYRRLMSNFRCTCLILAIWGISMLFGLTDILVAAANKLDVCTMRGTDEYDMSQPIICLCFLVLICIVVVYVRIYCIVRHLHNPNQTPQHDEMHNSKALVTTLLIIISFVICWIPHVAYQLFQHLVCKTYALEHIDMLLLIHKILFVLLQLNTCADPLIYACRLGSVQLGYKEVFYKVFKRKRYAANEVGFRHDQATFTSKCRHPVSAILQQQVSLEKLTSEKLIHDTSDQIDCKVNYADEHSANKIIKHYSWTESTNGIGLELEILSNCTESVAFSPSSDQIDWSSI